MANSIGLGLSIETVGEFNRRALIALRGVSFGYGNRSQAVVDACRTRFNSSEDLTEAQQKALYAICHRFRAQITDTLVREYAVSRVKECDA